VHYISRTLTE